MRTLTSPCNLKHHPSPLPDAFMYQGKEYRMAGASTMDLASTIRGKDLIGFIVFMADAENKITLWFGLHRNLTIEPFLAVIGSPDDTREQATTTYEKIVMSPPSKGRKAGSLVV